MKTYLVETVVIFRERYAIKARSESDALDTIVMNEAEPFDSKFIDENILSVRKIKKSKLRDLTDQKWLTEEQMIHEVEYDEEPTPSDGGDGDQREPALDKLRAFYRRTNIP